MVDWVLGARNHVGLFSPSPKNAFQPSFPVVLTWYYGETFIQPPSYALYTVIFHRVPLPRTRRAARHTRVARGSVGQFFAFFPSKNCWGGGESLARLAIGNDRNLATPPAVVPIRIFTRVFSIPNLSRSTPSKYRAIWR